ncbi:MAG: biotin--[acetyl-CoA-carboxylase] ligase [Microbacteriaceae bacterium]|nr:biotin--[acetyl-CoA-carboxylase] ligase [Microbacteriaceae bacterium]
MHLPLSAAIAARLDVLDEVGSTNTELAARAAGSPDFSVLVTGSQTSGRGRLGRTWVAPPGTTLAISVLLRPGLPADALGWIPLAAGLAMSRAVAALVPLHRVGLKWPNDVQVDGLKVSGLLAELLPDGSGVIMGAGLNLTMTREQLPTAASTSLSLNGTTVPDADLADAALSSYLENLRSLLARLSTARGDAVGAGIAAEVEAACTTLGQEVRVELPGGDDLVGTAVDLDSTGRLRVRRGSDARLVAVAAGDVTHLRYE